MERTSTIRTGGASSSRAARTSALREPAQAGGLGLPRPSALARALAPALSGLVLGASLLGLPLSTAHLAQFEALNRELGKLCSKPPPQALAVCRLHARLVSGL